MAKDLPAGYVMPTYLMATDQFMPDCVMVHKMKEWPKWDIIRNAKVSDFIDHPWYKIWDQVPKGGVCDKGKGPEVPVGGVCMLDNVGMESIDVRMEDRESVQGETLQGQTASHAVDRLSTRGQTKSRRWSKSVKSTATVDSDDGASATSSTHTDD